MSKHQHIALYERRSRDDELQGESNSIPNPKRLWGDYAKKQGFDKFWYFTDDGIRSTIFERTDFAMRYRAEDETALDCISTMKYLQCFQYPVADMGIYKECPKICSIGIDSERVQSFGELEGKEMITDVMFYYLETEKQYE